ncbi:MAG: DUF11 domain-containing protein, partial [Clostridiales bacterium]|nr:DUF11 domain-containing protein [Clostridiales bacterium]
SVGDEITYIISYYNNTNTVADVTITDTLDAGLTYVSSDPEGTETNGTVKWVISNVAPFTSGSVTVTVQVNSDAVDEGTVENTASVAIGDTAAVETDPVENPVDDDPQDPVKTATNVNADDSVAVGDTITYTISYYNHLGTAATVVVTDELDAGLDFDSAEGGTYNEETRTVTWTIENVAAHTSGKVTLTVKVNENAKKTTVSNSASVQIGDNKAVDTDPVDVPVDDDEKTPEKAVSAESTAGVDGTDVKVDDTIVYTISYYNNLGVAADVVITDVLDSGVDFVEASNGGEYDADTNTVKWTITDVAAYTDGTVTLTVTVNESARTQDEGEDAASVQNTASVSIDNAAAVDTNTVNNDIEDDDPVTPVKSVDLDADGVNDDGANVAVGDVLTYSITYYNHHNTTATVTITDVLDAGVSFVSASDDGVYDADTNTVTWTLTDVAAFTGGSVTLQVQVTDDAKTIEAGETQATVENTATVAVTCGEDVVTDTSNTVVNPVDDEEPVEPQKFVSASSAAGVSGANVSVGDEITYIISYYNNTNTVATVTITDPLDAGLDFVEASDGGTYSEDDNTVTWVGSSRTWLLTPARLSA